LKFRAPVVSSVGNLQLSAPQSILTHDVAGRSTSLVHNGRNLMNSRSSFYQHQAEACLQQHGTALRYFCNVMEVGSRQVKRPAELAVSSAECCSSVLTSRSCCVNNASSPTVLLPTHVSYIHTYIHFHEKFTALLIIKHAIYETRYCNDCIKYDDVRENVKTLILIHYEASDRYRHLLLTLRQTILVSSQPPRSTQPSIPS